MNPKRLIEVAYATPEKQLILELEIEAGTAIADALALSGITDHFPEIDLSSCHYGIFGKMVGADYELDNG